MYKKCIPTDKCMEDTADTYRSGLSARNQRSCRSRWLSSRAPGDPSMSTRQSEWCCDWQPPLAGDWGGSGGLSSRGRGHPRTSQWSSPPAQTDNRLHLRFSFFKYGRPVKTLRGLWKFIVPFTNRDPMLRFTLSELQWIDQRRHISCQLLVVINQLQTCEKDHV